MLLLLLLLLLASTPAYEDSMLSASLFHLKHASIVNINTVACLPPACLEELTKSMKPNSVIELRAHM